MPAPGAAVLGLGLALSSTAIVLPLLGERELLTTPAGRDAFAVLLFQDLAFIPLVALVPLLASGHAITGGLPWLQVAKGLAAIALILGGGRFLMRPLFRAIGGASSPELFTTAALLIVTGTALLAQAAGLSPSLGRVPGGRDAFGFRIPARVAGGYRAVREHAARVFLHFRRNVGRFARGGGAADRTRGRDRRAAGR